MGTMYLKTRYNCYAGRYAKSLDDGRRAEKRDCLKTLAKHIIPQYVEKSLHNGNFYYIL